MKNVINIYLRKTLILAEYSCKSGYCRGSTLLFIIFLKTEIEKSKGRIERIIEQETLESGADVCYYYRCFCRMSGEFQATVLPVIEQ